MEIAPKGTRTSKGPRAWFTGDAYVDEVASEAGVSRARAAIVHFTPGARTHWHTHEYGQTIYVLDGCGRCQRRGGRLCEIRAGDRVYFEPGEVHWHGAAPDRMMSHLHVQHVGPDGQSTAFLAPVSEAEYDACVSEGSGDL